HSRTKRISRSSRVRSTNSCCRFTVHLPRFELAGHLRRSYQTPTASVPCPSYQHVKRILFVPYPVCRAEHRSRGTCGDKTPRDVRLTSVAQLRLAMAQVNPTVGDLEGNSDL